MPAVSVPGAGWLCSSFYRILARVVQEVVGFAAGSYSYSDDGEGNKPEKESVEEVQDVLQLTAPGGGAPVLEAKEGAQANWIQKGPDVRLGPF